MGKKVKVDDRRICRCCGDKSRDLKDGVCKKCIGKLERGEEIGNCYVCGRSFSECTCE
jgi:hypothetical protein